MASVHPVIKARGRVVHQLHYRLAGRQRKLTFDDETAALRWCDVFNAVGAVQGLAMLDAADTTGPRVPTVEETLERHVHDLTGITIGTRAHYLIEARRDIYPTLGPLPVSSLTKPVVAAWVNGLAARGLSGKTITNRHSLLSAAAALAVADGHLEDNPCKGMRLPRTVRREMTFLTHDEFGLLYMQVPPYWQPLVTLLVGTGMRWGEATALRPGDVNLHRREVSVRRAWKHAKGIGYSVGPPKTTRSTRTVKFGTELADILEPLPTSDLLFVNHNGDPVRNNTFWQRVWTPAVKRAQAAGLDKKPRVHDLRHSFASWALQAGVPVFEVSRQMGHESVTTTADLYGHHAPNVGEATAAAVGAALSLALRPAVR